jgi:hypothetical protein
LCPAQRAALLKISAVEANVQEKPRGAPLNDPWKAWVFEVGLEGGLSGKRFTRVAASRELRGAPRDAGVIQLRFGYEYEDHVTDQEFDDQGNVTTEETFRTCSATGTRNTCS